MLLLPHSTHVHLSHVSACSAGARSTNFDMLPLTACALRATVMTGGQCCRHVGAATAACTAHVPDLRTTLWTSVLGCGVLLWSLSNQTPCSTWLPGPFIGPVETRTKMPTAKKIRKNRHQGTKGLEVEGLAEYFRLACWGTILGACDGHVGASAAMHGGGYEALLGVGE